MLSNPNHAMFEGLKLMHKNWVIKGYDQSMNLPVMLMKNLRTQLLMVLFITLRSIYRKQAIVTTHKQSLKSIGKNEENNSENFKTKKITLAIENNF